MIWSILCVVVSWLVILLVVVCLGAIFLLLVSCSIDRAAEHIRVIPVRVCITLKFSNLLVIRMMFL